MCNKKFALQVGEIWKCSPAKTCNLCTSHNLKYGNRTYILYSSMAMHITLSSIYYGTICMQKSFKLE